MAQVTARSLAYARLLLGIFSPPRPGFKYLMVVLFGFSWALASFGVSQNHNGDYAQYVIHALNLYSGYGWDFGLAGYPAVLPLYSLLISPIVGIFGVNFTLLSMANAVLWCFAYLAVASIPFESRRTRTRVQVLGVFGLFSPLALGFTLAATNHLLFAAFCTLLVASVEHYRVKPSVGREFLMILIALALALTRIEATWVLAALWAFGAIKLSQRIAFAALTPVPLTVSNLIEQNSSLGGYASAASPVKLFSMAGELFAHYVEKTGNTLALITKIYLDLGNSNIAVAIGAILLIALVFSLKTARNSSLVAMAIILTQPTITFLGELSTTPPQYLLGAAMTLPIAIGSMKMFELADSKRALFVALIPIVLLPAQVHASLEYNRSNFYDSESLTQATQFASESREDGPIGFYKPRIMTLKLCSETETCVQAVGMRSVEQALRVLDNRGVIVLRESAGYGQETILQFLKSSTTVSTSQFGEYVVYHVLAD